VKPINPAIQPYETRYQTLLPEKAGIENTYKNRNSTIPQ